MKKMWLTIILFICGCTLSLAQLPGQIPEVGFSDQYKSENTLGEYTFGYNEDHTSGGSFRRETSDHLGNKVGSYGLRVGDGRVRIVNYVADHNGFRADIISNEPGIESQDSNQFSKITKDNIYTVLVPGFKYASAAPYVTFEGNQQGSISYASALDEPEHAFNTEDSNFDGEDLRSEYLGGDVQHENPVGVFSNEDGSLGTIYSEEDPSTIYMNEGQVLDDSYLDGEYSHDSETVLQNQTSTNLEENASSVSSVQESKDNDFTSTTVSPSLKDEDLGNLRLSYESKYHFENANEDLYPFQSSVVLRKSQDNVASPDQQNTTLQSDNSKIQTTTTNSTTVVA